MAIKEIVVPDIGGFSDVEVVEVLVSPGDTIAPEDSLITLETDKASMEIPAPESGVVKELKVAVGDRIDEGGVILLLESEGETAAEPAPVSADVAPQAEPSAANEAAPASGGDLVEVHVPDIGGFDAVEVIEVLVSPGDTVAAEDSLITLESDKASMEIPSPQAGVVKAVDVKVGDKIGEGGLILTLVPDGQSGVESSQSATKDAIPTPPQIQEAAAPVEALSEVREVFVPDIGDFDEVEVIEVLVSPGDIINAEDSVITLESDKASMEIPSPYSGVVMDLEVAVGDKVAKGSPILHLQLGTEVSSPAPEPAPEPEKEEAPAPVAKRAPTADFDEVKFSKAYASPAVRRFARELGVDLGVVKGSGRKNRILKDDVQGFVKHVMEATASGTKVESTGSGIPGMPDVDFSKIGEIESIPLTKINRLTGKNLHRAWLNVPHVTQFDETDITDLEAFRKQLVGEYKDQGIKVTMLTFLVKAVAAGLKEFPRFNTSLDATGENLIQKKYINIGVAVDTPAGLVVPVIKDADKKSLLELAAEMMELGKKARDKKLKPTDMQGGCFTISSLGGLGGVQFTPIVNAPEVAILGVSRSAMKPVWNGNDFDARLILPLALSYDHRVIDGAAGVRFTSYLGRVLNDPRRLLL
ncbi:MAG: dihydrolipoyllysine-residue acetyltransferase [bacterium]